jgi:hypothetical protein
MSSERAFLATNREFKRALEEEDFEQAVKLAQTKHSTIFRYLIHGDKLDILIRLAQAKVFPNKSDSVFALKDGKYEILRWMIRMEITPPKNIVLKDAEERNDFQHAELMEKNGCKFSRPNANYAYQNDLLNVLTWLEARDIRIREEDKILFDQKKEKRNANIVPPAQA